VFKRRSTTERSRKFRSGDLIDMQLPPFRQFNRIVENDYPLYMTRAAFQACVELPGEKRGRAAIPAIGRWGIVYLSFATEFQGRSDERYQRSVGSLS
jgi:hypothetical protein